MPTTNDPFHDVHAEMCRKDQARAVRQQEQFRQMDEQIDEYRRMQAETSQSRGFTVKDFSLIAGALQTLAGLCGLVMIVLKLDERVTMSWVKISAFFWGLPVLAAAIIAIWALWEALWKSGADLTHISDSGAEWDAAAGDSKGDPS